MLKTKIIEITEKYDKDGKIVEKTTKEETTEDDETRASISPISSNWGMAPIPCCGKKELSVTW